MTDLPWATSASFSSIWAFQETTSASFPRIWGQDWPGLMLVNVPAWILANVAPNARKRSTGAPHRGQSAGKRSTGAVLKAKVEIMKKYFVCREGHSKLQKIAFGKICPLNSHFFFDDAFFTKRAVVGGNPRYFWVRNLVPWPEIANRAGGLGGWLPGRWLERPPLL